MYYFHQHLKMTSRRWKLRSILTLLSYRVDVAFMVVCGPKRYGFSSLAILIINRVWFCTVILNGASVLKEATFSSLLVRPINKGSSRLLYHWFQLKQGLDLGSGHKQGSENHRFWPRVLGSGPHTPTQFFSVRVPHTCPSMWDNQTSQQQKYKTYGKQQETVYKIICLQQYDCNSIPKKATKYTVCTH